MERSTHSLTHSQRLHLKLFNLNDRNWLVVFLQLPSALTSCDNAVENEVDVRRPARDNAHADQHREMVVAPPINASRRSAAGKRRSIKNAGHWKYRDLGNKATSLRHWKMTYARSTFSFLGLICNRHHDDESAAGPARLHNKRLSLFNHFFLIHLLLILILIGTL